MLLPLCVEYSFMAYVNNSRRYFSCDLEIRISFKLWFLWSISKGKRLIIIKVGTFGLTL